MKNKKTGELNNQIINEAAEIFLSDDRYALLDADSKGIALIIKELMPELMPEIEGLKDVVDLTKKSFTMRDFYKICKARNIQIKRSEENPLAGRSASELGCFAIYKTGSDHFIWIKTGLSRKRTRFIAAHEISHFCLHRHLLWGYEETPVTAFFSSNPLSQGKTFMKMEADVLASLLLAKKEAIQ